MYGLKKYEKRGGKMEATINRDYVKPAMVRPLAPIAALSTAFAKTNTYLFPLDCSLLMHKLRKQQVDSHS